MKLTSEELRDAYARGTSAGTGAHPEADVLSRLLQGNVSMEERARVVGHIAGCSRCAEEVRVAGAVADGLSKTGGPVVHPAVWRRRGILLAAAASVLVAGGLALRSREPRVTSEAPFRSADTPGLRSLLPAGAALRRDAAVLRWTGAAPGTTFDVLIANDRLDVLARLPGVRESEVAVPAFVLSRLPPGAKLVWRVISVQPDGTRSESRSFVVVLE